VDDNFLTIAMFAILAVLIFFMFRNSRKRKAQAEELQAKIVPGVEIMTNFGLFGTLISIDEVSNVAEIEVSPGNIVRVHRQTVAKVVTAVDSDGPRSVEEAMEIANREAAARENNDAVVGEPEFGERVDTLEEPTAESSKRSAKKDDE